MDYDQYPAQHVKPLFPAAASIPSEDISTNDTEYSERQDWLQLNSFSGLPSKAQEKSPEVSFSSSDGYSSDNQQPWSVSPSHDGSKRNTLKKKKKKKKKEKKRIVDVAVSSENRKPKVIWREDALLQTNEPYRLDKKKDAENLQFNTLYRLDIAKFNSKFYNCVGVKSKRISLMIRGSRKQKRLKPLHPRRYHSDAITDDISGPTLKLSSINRKTDANTDFILVEETSTNPEKGITEDQSDDRDPISLKTEEFNKLLRENPHDVSKWLEFAAFQRLFVKGNVEISDTLINPAQSANPASKMVVEKQVAILERAMEKNPKSFELLTTYMNLCKEICDAPTYASKWKSIVFKQPNNVELWRQFLLANQSYFSSFTVSKSLSDYKKCFTTLVSIQEGVIKSHTPHDDFVETTMALFLQRNLFLCQAGHTEKAVAAFQALVEFNCFCPTDFHGMDSKTRKKFFQCYYATEFPRIGDSAVCSWQTWYEIHKSKERDSSMPDLPSETEEPSLELADRNVDRAKEWLRLECGRGRQHFRPYSAWNKKEEDDDCDDPDRIVLFDDMEHVLFSIHSEALVLQLLLMFLGFLGVPIPSTLLLRETRRVFSQLMARLPCLVFSTDVHWLLYGGSPVSISTFLGDLNGKRENLDIGSEQLLFIRNVLSHCVNTITNHEIVRQISDIWLKFELLMFIELTKASGKSKRKSCKRVLQDTCKSILAHPHNRTCLQLWTTYAIVEYHASSQASARKVLQMSLSSMQAIDVNGYWSPFAAYRFFIELELGLMSSMIPSQWTDDQKTHVLIILSAMSSGKPLASDFSSVKLSPAVLLTMKSDFSTKTTEILSSIKSETEDLNLHMADWICCHAIFDYFNCNKESCVQLIDHTYDALRNRNNAITTDICRNLLSFKVALLRQCEIVGICSYKLVERTLIDALLVCPDAPWIVAMFLQTVTNFLSSLEMRRSFEHCLASLPSAWSYWVAIEYEKLKRNKIIAVADLTNQEAMNATEKGISLTTIPNSGINHRIRSLYSRATESPESCYCLSLWRQFIQFEVSLDNIEKAKSVYYRALQRCPWSKELFMDAIRSFDGTLESTVDLMQEKEIRVRLPLEEFEIMWNE